MSIEELDFQKTVLGELILRRRRSLRVNEPDIFEVKLNEEYLMSSLFHEGEEALADLALAALLADEGGWVEQLTWTPDGTVLAAAARASSSGEIPLS